MTESEAIAKCQSCNNRCPQAEMACEIAKGRMYATDELIKCQKELEQYRAIGTVEELKSMKENGAFSALEMVQIAAKLNKLKEYEDIGTVSEFRELKEKATAKESYGIKCPHCNFYTSNGRYCCNCGKMLIAKSEGKE